MPIRTEYNKLYLISFEKHTIYFATSARRSRFSDHILDPGHQMRSMEEIITILHFESIEEIEMMKATPYDHRLITYRTHYTKYYFCCYKPIAAQIPHNAGFYARNDGDLNL